MDGEEYNNMEYKLEHSEVRARNNRTDLPILDPNLTENKVRGVTHYIRVIRYDFSMYEDYLPVQEFKKKRWYEREDMQQALELKVRNLYYQMNRRIVKELFIPPQERKMHIHPLVQVWVQPDTNCHVQFTVINTVVSVAEEKGKEKWYYQTRRIFPSPLFDATNLLPEELFDGDVWYKLQPRKCRDK